jgi:hypothetical protein
MARLTDCSRRLEGRCVEGSRRLPVTQIGQDAAGVAKGENGPLDKLFSPAKLALFRGLAAHV